MRATSVALLERLGRRERQPVDNACNGEDTPYDGACRGHKVGERLAGLGMYDAHRRDLVVEEHALQALRRV